MIFNKGIKKLKCKLCWFRCGTDRTRTTGRCGIDSAIHVAHYGLHTGEEPYLTGAGGSGTIFFAGCTLRCTFCQNHQISRWTLKDKCTGTIVLSPEKLADVFFELKTLGAANINFVSPTPYVHGIIEAVGISRSRGFNLPFVYNTHGYDTPETIESLKGIIDIYLPDFKYGIDRLGEELSGAPGMYRLGRETMRSIYAQAGNLIFDSSGLAVKGTAIRHLVLPGHTENSLNVLDFLETIDKQLHLSLMSQFHPCGEPDRSHPELNRSLEVDEYEKVVQYAESLGFRNLLLQELESHGSYLPDFRREKVFEE